MALYKMRRAKGGSVSLMTPMVTVFSRNVRAVPPSGVRCEDLGFYRITAVNLCMCRSVWWQVKRRSCDRSGMLQQLEEVTC